MAFDDPDFGRKNYEEYLRGARETLRVKHLTDDDRRIIERGIYYLMRGDDLFKREDPESLREAAWLFLTGAYYLGARCAVSESEKKYWNLKEPRPGGGGKRTPPEQGRRRLARMGAPRNYQGTEPSAGAGRSHRNMRANKTAPGNLPSHDRLVRFIREELKSRNAGKKNSLRLVG